MSNRSCLCMVLRGVSATLTFRIALLAFVGVVATGKTLFRDDFEGDTIGNAPQNFDKYEGEGPHNRDDFELEIVEDPEGESGKVVHTYSTGLLLPQAAGRDDWTDWLWEWDWMWSDLGYGGTAFRLTDDNYYHISPRNDNIHLGFWLWNGAWNQIGGLAEYAFELNTWYRFEVTARGDEFTLKIKRRDDTTTFAEIEPLMEITDNTLKTGPMGVYGWNKGDAWMDNFIVGETEADMTFSMELAGKLATTWGAIKHQD